MDVLTNRDYWARYAHTRPDIHRFVIVADAIAREILESGVREGAIVPGMRGIAMACGNTAQTVQSALQRLVAEDIIAMEPGKPTRVKSIARTREYLARRAREAFSEGVSLQLLCGVALEDIIEQATALAGAR
jgi:DNA-binding FadR family transcriptional regulator